MRPRITNQAMATPTAIEDFSFPTFTTTTFSSTLDSPPLWHSSPAASPCHTTAGKQKEDDQEQEESDDQEEDFQDCFPTHKPTQRKSFSWIEQGRKGILNHGDEADGEEKMDMLWEDLNEELSTKMTRSQSSSKLLDSYDDDDNMVNMGCFQPQSSSKVSSNTTSKSSAVVSAHPRKQPGTGLVVFIKVLKKLFLLHSPHHTHHRHVQNHHLSSRLRRVKNRSRS